MATLNERDSLLPSFGLIGQVGFFAFLLALVLAPLMGGYPGGVEYGADTSLNAIRALLCVAGLCLGLSPLPDNENAKPGPLAKVASGATWALFVLTAVSLLVHSRFLSSPALLFALLPASLDWLCYALVFALALRLGANHRARPWLLGALVIGAGGAALMSVREYGQFAQAGMRGQRAQGAFFSPNFAGGFFGLLLPLCAAWCLSVRERLGSLTLGVVAALCAGATVATGSRAGIALAALGLAFAFVAALVVYRGRLLWARVAVLLIAAVVLGFAFRGPLTTRSAAGSNQEHSGAFRAWTWKGAARMAQANPALGTGPGTFTYRYAPYALVARTDLAHSSYLQTATEQGLPALVAAIVAITTSFLAGIVALFRRKREGNDDKATFDAAPLLLCGLLGGLLVGAARSVFDSEWSILGNGIPFWTGAGLCASGLGVQAVQPATRKTAHPPVALRYVPVFLVIPLVFALLLLQTVVARDAAQEKVRAQQPATPPTQSWPPDPTIAYLNGKPEEAAVIEPSAKRFYQLARFHEREGKIDKAIADYQKATVADPTRMQTWRRLAEAYEQTGQQERPVRQERPVQTDKALQAWRKIADLQEGPVGQIRAIPELPETYPAFAYFALGQAEENTDKTKAQALYERGAKVVEQYAQTEPLYQQMEILSAQANGIDIQTRRSEVQEVYKKIVARLIALNPDTPIPFMEREATTLKKIEAFATVPPRP
jgi:O-antigen ligase